MTRIFLIAFLFLSNGCASQPPPAIRLATTSSVENSGLLEAILPAYERSAHVRVEVVPVGSGRALELLRRGDAAAGLTHDPRAEAAEIAAGAISDYRKVMFNDFLIVGPRIDPASAGGAPDAVAAMLRIASSPGALFVSRGDASGTHSREQELWGMAEGPPEQDRLLESGPGMAATLRIASERQGYTLTDRATFDQLVSELALAPLFEGGPQLLNTYAIFLRAGLADTERAAAVNLIEWISDGEGRTLIGAFQPNGRPAFTVWPASLSRSRPTDLP